MNHHVPHPAQAPLSSASPEPPAPTATSPLLSGGAPARTQVTFPPFFPSPGVEDAKMFFLSPYQGSGAPRADSPS